MVDLTERYAALEYQRMVAEQKRVAKEVADTEHKHVEGIGELVARIPLREYLSAKAPNRYGHFCWHDPDFVKAYIRDNPQDQVKTRRGVRGQELPKGTIFVPPTYASSR